MDLGGAIISIASLSFLGLVWQPLNLNGGATESEESIWVICTLDYDLSRLFLFLTVMSVNLLGDRLSIALDARQSVDKGKV